MPDEGTGRKGVAADAAGMRAIVLLGWLLLGPAHTAEPEDARVVRAVIEAQLRRSAPTTARRRTVSMSVCGS